jgi:Holliday junction resolvase RusA-like endonuclease
MNRSLSLVVPFEPFPARRANPGRCYEGRKYSKMTMNPVYRAWRDKVEEWLDGQQLPLLEGPLASMVLHIRKRPKNTTMEYPPGDFDNLTKAIIDCFNKRVFSDDNQIVDNTTGKRWSDPGEDGCIVVYLREVDDGK